MEWVAMFTMSKVGFSAVSLGPVLDAIVRPPRVIAAVSEDCGLITENSTETSDDGLIIELPRFTSEMGSITEPVT